MKKLLFVFLFIFGSVIYAQEETFMGQEEVSNGGFGAPVIKFTSINSQFGVLVGGKGGWIINHSIILGAGGYGLVNQTDGPVSSVSNNVSLVLGYGGFEMGYIISSDKIVHSAVGILIGAGAVSQRKNYNIFNYNITLPNLAALGYDNFFIAEPEVDIEFNIVRFLRIDIGASYRIISGVNQNGLKNSDLAGVSGIMTLKFGKF